MNLLYSYLFAHGIYFSSELHVHVSAIVYGTSSGTLTFGPKRKVEDFAMPNECKQGYVQHWLKNNIMYGMCCIIIRRRSEPYVTCGQKNELSKTLVFPFQISSNGNTSTKICIFQINMLRYWLRKMKAGKESEVHLLLRNAALRIIVYWNIRVAQTRIWYRKEGRERQ